MPSIGKVKVFVAPSHAIAKSCVLFVAVCWVHASFSCVRITDVEAVSPAVVLIGGVLAFAVAGGGRTGRRTSCCFAWWLGSVVGTRIGVVVLYLRLETVDFCNKVSDEGGVVRNRAVSHGTIAVLDVIDGRWDGLGDRW